MKLSGKLRDFVVEWDIVNWERAISFWKVEKILRTFNKPVNEIRVLDIGARRGGLSLYFANLGACVECTDIQDTALTAMPLHKQFMPFSGKIFYFAKNIITMDDENKYDIICFKSVLGALGELQIQEKVIQNIYRALKPGGKLIFAENLVSTPVHMYLRKKFNKYRWRYVELDELISMLECYTNIRINTYGFLGCLGLNERHRKILGYIDKMLDFFLPKSAKYIASVTAQKPLK